MAIEENEQLYGPGKKLVIWCQGCSLHCPGCTNQALWNPNGGLDIKISYLLKIIKENNLDGVVFHGGEPMEQAETFLSLAKHLKNKIIVCFTGYNLEELVSPAQKELISYCDFLITGRFEIDKRNPSLQFRGSSNQKVYFPTGKFKDYKLKDNQEENLIFEINENEITVCGFWNEAFSKVLK